MVVVAIEAYGCSIKSIRSSVRACAYSFLATSFFLFLGGFDRRFDNVSAGTGLGIHTNTIDNWRAQSVVFI